MDSRQCGALWRMKYDGDGRATARFFSGKGCRRAPLFPLLSDAPRPDRFLLFLSPALLSRAWRLLPSQLDPAAVSAVLSHF
ncbi:hypothetical protein J4W50_22865, partial [Escherichia coli]